jgi:hypothetical protein
MFTVRVYVYRHDLIGVAAGLATTGAAADRARTRSRKRALWA